MITFLLALLSSCFLEPGTDPAPANLPVKTESVTRAIIIGISNYSDEDIPDIPLASRDAESFAAFLQSPSGGGIFKENIKLLTNSQASYSNLAAAIDWLQETTRPGDKVFLYFSGYGDARADLKGEPQFFYPYEAPLTPIRPNAIELKQVKAVLESLQADYLIEYTVVAHLYPVVMDPEMDFQPSHLAEASTGDFPFSTTLNTITESTFRMHPRTIGASKLSLNHLLLDGLMGLADDNNDLSISARELKKYLRKTEPLPQTCPGILMVGTSDKNLFLSKTDPKILKSLKEHSDGLFPSIVHLETSLKEDSIIENAPDRARVLYHDFIVQTKLGNLLTPAGRNALLLYDSLLQQPSLKPLYSDLRRKLAAALQDETQQALNAYLVMDTRELNRRKRDGQTYFLYADYLKKANELLGKRNFMKSILTAKQLYFEGVGWRIEGITEKKDSLLHLALATQQQALDYENQAAFIYNEIGLVHNYLGNFEKARENFQKALEFSPNWCIPHSNLGLVNIRLHKFEEALQHAKQSVRLNPRNAFVLNNIGFVYAEMDDLSNAETAFNRAKKADDTNAQVFYNLACVYARQGHHHRALEHLKLACSKGWTDKNLLLEDEDLAFLRNMVEEWYLLMTECFPP